MCLFHDLPESRTGDLNYVNKHYVDVKEDQAIRDLAKTLPFGEELQKLHEEFKEGETREAKLARDADQLDLILELKEHQDLGNRYAEDWIYFACKRLKTDLGKELASQILETDSTAWWFEGRDHWWTAE
jgi:putative hydrolase of HD superfamily